MRYWGYLAAKFVLVGLVVLGLWFSVPYLPEPVAGSIPDRAGQPFGRHLGFTFVMMLYTLIVVGVAWLAIRDQRYRCRTCARRLRMPITTGSWTYLLQMGRPRTEYICPFGHGTLRVEELQITGHSEPDWQPHEDIWKELLALEDSKK
jgi:hypothetical protein